MGTQGDTDRLFPFELVSPDAIGDAPEPGRLLLPWQAAKLCGVTVHTVARWTREGRLSSFLLPGGHRRYRTDDVLAILGTVQARSSGKEKGNG